MAPSQYVVVGAGLAAAATSWSLARPDHEVTVVERAQPAAPDGSSHGSARIFRCAYPDALCIRLVIEARTFADLAPRYGLDPAFLGPDEERLRRIGKLVDLHVEQGRRRVDLHQPVAIGASILDYAVSGELPTSNEPPGATPAGSPNDGDRLSMSILLILDTSRRSGRDRVTARSPRWACSDPADRARQTARAPPSWRC